MEAEWSDDPEVLCSCGKHFTVSDGFEEGPGSEALCPYCGTVLECEDEENVRRWSWRPVEPAGGAR
jgi:hypothetical protein